MTYEFRVTENFARRARKKPRQMQESIARCIKMLVENPKAARLNTHKMKGRNGIWEAYIDNDGNRLTFEWDGSTIVLRNNCNHDMLYKNP